MKLHLLALLAFSTAACDTDGLLGGRFYGGELAQHTDVEAGETSDAGQEAGDDAAPEAGGDSAIQVADAGHEDSGRDAGAQDSGVVDNDTGTTEPDSGEAMEAATEAGATCPGALPCEPTSHYPVWFCLVPHQGDGDGAWPSPVECNTCGTYTCACILAHSTYVSDAGCTCSTNSDGAVSIVCQ